MSAFAERPVPEHFGMNPAAAGELAPARTGDQQRFPGRMLQVSQCLCQILGLVDTQAHHVVLSAAQVRGPQCQQLNSADTRLTSDRWQPLNSESSSSAAARLELRPPCRRRGVRGCSGNRAPPSRSRIAQLSADETWGKAVAEEMAALAARLHER